MRKRPGRTALANDISCEELQQYELNVLRSVDAFCRTNHIRYSLFYGTLLGAVRHKGFIPWDDDVDIVMPREDYNRFIRTYRDSRYVLKSVETDPDWPFGFAKCMDMRLLVDEHLRGCGPFGAYVDIFPIDGLPDDLKQIERIYKKIWRRWLILELGRWPMRKKGEINPIKAALRFAATNTFWALRRIVMDRFVSDARKYDYDSSKYAGVQCLGTYLEKNCLEREKLGGITDITFEGERFLAFEGYDYYLSHIYGDYMKLPPQDQRIVHNHDLRWNDQI